MSREQLNQDKLMDLFEELNTRLASKNLRGEIVLSGGSVLVLVLKARPRTKDVDAIWEPKEVIHKLAVEIAEEHGINPDWLNDGVKGWISSIPEKKVFHKYSNLTIYHADLRYLLAMKCLAARPDALDREDVKTLVNALGITSVKDCLDILFKFYPQRLVEQKSIYFIEEIFDELKKR